MEIISNVSSVTLTPKDHKINHKQYKLLANLDEAAITELPLNELLQ